MDALILTAYFLFLAMALSLSLSSFCALSLQSKLGRDPLSSIGDQLRSLLLCWEVLATSVNGALLPTKPFLFLASSLVNTLITVLHSLLFLRAPPPLTEAAVLVRNIEFRRRPSDMHSDATCGCHLRDYVPKSLQSNRNKP